MQLREILQQFESIDVENTGDIEAWLENLSTYCQPIIDNSEESEIIHELSFRLQMIRRITWNDYKKVAPISNKIKNLSHQHPFRYFQAAIKQAIETPIYAAQTDALDDIPSYAIDNATLHQLETKNNCDQPLANDTTIREKELNDTCRELGQEPYPLGIDVPKFDIYADIGSGQCDPNELIQRLHKITNNQAVVERFARRANFNGFATVIDGYVRNILTSKNKDRQYTGYLLQCDSSKTSTQLYKSDDGAIYMRIVSPLIRTKTYDDSRLVFAYTDCLIRIDADRETIISSRIVPFDDLAYSLFDIKKEQVKVHRPILSLRESKFIEVRKGNKEPELIVWKENKHWLENLRGNLTVYLQQSRFIWWPKRWLAQQLLSTCKHAITESSKENKDLQPIQDVEKLLAKILSKYGKAGFNGRESFLVKLVNEANTKRLFNSQDINRTHREAENLAKLKSERDSHAATKAQLTKTEDSYTSTNATLLETQATALNLDSQVQQETENKNTARQQLIDQERSFNAERMGWNTIKEKLEKQVSTANANEQKARDDLEQVANDLTDTNAKNITLVVENAALRESIGNPSEVEHKVIGNLKQENRNLNTKYILLTRMYSFVCNSFGFSIAKGNHAKNFELASTKRTVAKDNPVLSNITTKNNDVANADSSTFSSSFFGGNQQHNG